MTQSATLSKTPLKTSEHKSVTKMSLQNVYTSWLELEHPKKAGSFNRDRTKSDLLNFRRALQCVAAGSGHSWKELHQVPLKALEINEALLTDRVTIGCQILAERKGKVASKKTIANTLSCVKAIRNTVLESYNRPAEGPGPIQIYKDMPKRRYRPKFARKAWPERLKREWAAYREWKLKPTDT